MDAQQTVQRKSHNQPKSKDASPAPSPSDEHLTTRIVQIGLLVNLALAGVKLAGGWIFKSKSLTADGWHSVTDLVADVLALVAVVVTSALRASDKSAAGKVEALMSLAASGLLGFLGVHIGWESGMSFKAQFFARSAAQAVSPEMLEEEMPSVQAVWVAILTILVKEWLYHATMKVATKTKSSVLASSAVHQRSDSLMSVVTVLAILGSVVFENTIWIDSVGGLCISFLIVHAAVENIHTTLRAEKS